MICRPLDYRFNTQPPEGGCLTSTGGSPPTAMFQHTAARRRLPVLSKRPCASRSFQHTAARRRLPRCCARRLAAASFQHTAARRRLPPTLCHPATSGRRFNTQPPEGGCPQHKAHRAHGLLFQHTAARRRLRAGRSGPPGAGWFQHTAARRRLPPDKNRKAPDRRVSTHSRPKAAARARGRNRTWPPGFNTQPPEGGCRAQQTMKRKVGRFQHTPPMGPAPALGRVGVVVPTVSTHSRPKAAALWVCTG